MERNDYYAQKKRCYSWIEDAIRKNPDGILQSFLIHEVNIRWGFGKKMVTDFVNILLDMNKITEIEGVLKWKRN